MQDKMIKRLLMSLVGALLTGVAGGIFKTSLFGVGPYQAMSFGLLYIVPVSFGLLAIIINAVLLVFPLIFDRSKLGVGTIFVCFLLGYATEYTMKLTAILLPNPGIGARVICLILGVLLNSFATALYMTANLGISPYDSIAVVMSEKWKWGQFRFIRICTDVFCVVLGTAVCLAVSGSWKEVLGFEGIGTIIVAFFMGPMVQFWKDHAASRLLNGKENTGENSYENGKE